MTEGLADVVDAAKQVAGASTQWTAIYAGDTALIFQFGDTIDSAIVEKVNNLDAIIHTAMLAGELEGVLETIPTFRSLAVIYDSSVLPPDKLLERVRTLERKPVSNSDIILHPPRHWRLPVLYGTERGPDLNSVSELTGLSPADVIDLHSSCSFTVYMLGFLPGYAFLGDTPDALYLPRRSEPRLRVPAGSVAIAMQLTGIYPWESPGGWHILGNCPVPMFNARQSPPTLLKAGDKVSFTRIDQNEFDVLKNELSESDSDSRRWAIDEQ